MCNAPRRTSARPAPAPRVYRRFHTYSLLSCMTSCLFIRVQCTRRGPRLGLQMCPRFAFIWGVRRWPARAAQVVFQRRLIVFYVFGSVCECGRVVRLVHLCVCACLAAQKSSHPLRRLCEASERLRSDRGRGRMNNALCPVGRRFIAWRALHERIGRELATPDVSGPCSGLRDVGLTKLFGRSARNEVSAVTQCHYTF